MVLAIYSDSEFLFYAKLTPVPKWNMWKEYRWGPNGPQMNFTRITDTTGILCIIVFEH